MDFDRALTDAEPMGDDLVGSPGGDQFEDVMLAAGERVEALANALMPALLLAILGAALLALEAFAWRKGWSM